MRIKVDTEKCQGHNRCYSLAPELFDIENRLEDSPSYKNLPRNTPSTIQIAAKRGI